MLKPLQALLASLRLAHSPAREREPSAQFLAPQAPPLGLLSPVLRVRQASPLAQEALLAQPVLQPQEQRSPAEAPELPQASFAQLSPPHPSRLFLP